MVIQEQIGGVIEEDIRIRQAPATYIQEPVAQPVPQAVLYSDADRDGVPDMWQGKGGFAIIGSDLNRDGIPDALQPQVMPAPVTYPGTLIGGTTGYVGGGTVIGGTTGGYVTGGPVIGGAGAFNALDRNGDGVITRAEFNSGVRPATGGYVSGGTVIGGTTGYVGGGTIGGTSGGYVSGGTIGGTTGGYVS